jgi:hypothetical protein
MEERFQDLKNFLSDDSTKYLGHLEDVIEYLKSNAHHAQRIFNTRVIATNNPHANVDRRYLDTIVNLVSRCVNQGVDWTGIISDNGQQRVDAIQRKITKDNNYNVYKIKDNLQIFNFVILRFSSSQLREGRRDVVIFGFGYHQYDTQDELFVSNDLRLIERFYQIFVL